MGEASSAAARSATELFSFKENENTADPEYHNPRVFMDLQIGTAHTHRVRGRHSHCRSARARGAHTHTARASVSCWGWACVRVTVHEAAHTAHTRRARAHTLILGTRTYTRAFLASWSIARVLCFFALAQLSRAKRVTRALARCEQGWAAGDRALRRRCPEDGRELPLPLYW